MSLLSTIFGAGKLLSNFIGGGGGASESANTTQNQDTITKQRADSQTKQAVSEQMRQTLGEAGQNSSAQVSENAQTSLQFSDGFLRALENSAMASLSRNNDASRVIGDRLGQVARPETAFDSNAYINSVMRDAGNTVASGMESDENKIMTVTGGSTTGNSQAALLASKMRNDAASRLAGIRGDATIRAAELNRVDRISRSEEIAGLTGSLDNGLASILAALKGGEVSSTNEEQVALRAANSKINETRQATANNTYNENVNSSLSEATQTSSGTSAASRPFNWSSAVGNIFKAVGT